MVGWRVVGAGLALVAVAVRVRNALVYPPDWGFDASFNWRYILRLAEDGALPPPDAGWSTGDPPLYFALGALLWRLCEALGSRDLVFTALPLLGTLVGLGLVVLAVRLVLHLEPGNERRAWIAALLLLYLPAHVQMSVMVNEQMVAAFFVSLAVYWLARAREGERRISGDREAVGVGVAAGLALLTKLSGATAFLAAAVTWGVQGARRVGRRRALRKLVVAGVLVLLLGGWYYVRNRVVYGYFQPYGLPAHEVMFRMPPGERDLGDYLRVPAATFTDPQLLNPDLLRSVWGSTYATLWFDGHRFFLPSEGPAVRRLGTATLLLALLPTLAFGFGLGAGALRLARSGRGADLPLLALVAATLGGYVLYTWQNPWFAVVKGTSLLGLSLPFAVYASEGIERAWRRSGVLAFGLSLGLAALCACVAAGTAFNGLFERSEVSGLRWEAPAPPPGGLAP